MKPGSVRRRSKTGGHEAMARQLYSLLALQPACFRYRFGFEMLAVFDEASAHRSKLPLLADGTLALKEIVAAALAAKGP